MHLAASFTRQQFARRVNSLLPRSRRSYATESTPGSNKVRILECAVRDGLQNEKAVISTELKVELAKRLAATGLTYIEGGSFVPAKWVPQMADTAQVLPLLPHGPGMVFPVITPNMRALDMIEKTNNVENVKEVIVITAASEGFSRANTNCTIKESLERTRDTTQRALKMGFKVRASISCVVGSPFEPGVPDPKLVRDMAKQMMDAGAYACALGDTIGVGNPLTTREMIEEVKKDVPASQLAIHCHDTYGMGVANVIAALEAGIRTVDSACSGLGGCPYAPGATGNVATEDILYALHGLGYETGVDLAKVAAVGDWMSEQLHRGNGSRVGRAMSSKAKRETASSAKL